MSKPRDRFAKVKMCGETYTARYWDTGKSAANYLPVVAIPGLMGYIEEWLPTLDVLSPLLRTIVIDPLGCGLSDKPEKGDYSLRGLALFIKSVLDELEISRAHLVGHSYGGAQMLALARAFPEMCESLVLVTPAGVAKNLGWILRMMTIPWLGELLSAPSRLASTVTMRMQIYDKRLVTRELIDIDQHYTSLPGEHRAALKTLREGCTIFGQKKETYRANEPFLGNPQNRILIVLGNKDPLIQSPTKRAIEKRFPHVQLKVYENCSHTPMLEKPEFNEFLLTFFRQ